MSAFDFLLKVIQPKISAVTNLLRHFCHPLSPPKDGKVFDVMICLEGHSLTLKQKRDLSVGVWKML